MSLVAGRFIKGCVFQSVAASETDLLRLTINHIFERKNAALETNNMYLYGLTKLLTEMSEVNSMWENLFLSLFK